MSQNSEYGENIQDYEVLGLLGKGGFAKVYRARCKRNNQLVAIKMIDKKLIQSAGLTNRVRQEVEIHSRLKHPFVVELYTFFQDADYVYLVMELATNGELQRYMKEHMGRPMNEQEAAGILHQVVTGILYLHSHRIMHRDISLSNLLLSKNMDVKIADFGLATQLKQNDEKHMTMCGTPNFISPEVASRSSHGLPADVWAIGCLLYTLLVGRPPFDTHAVQATLTKVVMSDYRLPEQLSYEAKDLINKLLKKDPNERIGLQNILMHPFMHRFQTTTMAAAGPVALDTFKYPTLKENGNTAAILQSPSSSAGYNMSNNSCDSGIITFASNTTANSLRPMLLSSSGNNRDQNYMQSSMATATTESCMSLQQNNLNFDHFQGPPNNAPNMDWQPTALAPSTTKEQPQWHLQPQCKLPSPSTVPVLQTKQQHHQSDVFYNNAHCLKETHAPMIAGIPTALPSTSTHTINLKQSNKPEQRLSVPPLDTTRLQPTRFRNKNAIMSILNGGEVVVEFIKYRGKLNEDRITDICWISKDGQRIVIYEPDPGRGLPISDEPPELPQHDTRVGIFSYENLPNKHWRKYLFAYRFVSLVKASTPKVTYFSEQAKFHLMESMLHFEVIFYDGSKVTQSPNEGLKIYDRHGRQLQPHEHTSPTATALLAHQDACLKHCETICNALELVQRSNGSDGCSCFPVVIGRRPNRERIGRLQHTEQMPNTNEAAYNAKAFPTTQAKNDNARTVSAITVPGVAKATELSNGVIHVQFYDGTLISVAAKSANSRAGDNRGFSYLQPNGVATHFAPDDELPLAVREKLSHLPGIEEQLKSSRVLTTHASSASLGRNENGYFSTPSSSKTARVYTSTPALSYTNSNDRFEYSSNSNTPQSTHAMRYFR